MLLDGGTLHKNDEIGRAFSEFYSSLFNSRGGSHIFNWNYIPVTKQVPTNIKPLLIVPITTQDIFEALKNIAEDKTPDIVGFSAKFFTSSWDIIGKQFLAAVQHFFTSKKLPRLFKHSLLTFIPKSKHANSIYDFRHISLFLTFYKVIAKVLASILKLALPHIINSAQPTFIQGRDIAENISLAQKKNYGKLNSGAHSKAFVLKLTFIKLLIE